MALGKKLVALAATAMVAACGGTGGGSGQAGTTSLVKLAIVEEDRAQNEPWAAAMIDSANNLAKSDPNVKITQTYDAFDPTKATPDIHTFLADGYSVIVMHSFALEDTAKSIAPQNPKTVFSVASFKDPTQPNLNIETASYLEVGYANCWMLAKLSKSGTIGIVGALPIPYATELLQGCQLGSAAANPAVKVVAAYSQSFTDQQANRTQAQNLINRGADGIFQASGTEDSISGFALCEQTKINCAGWAADSRQYAPNTAVTSVIVDWGVFLKKMVAQVRSGKLQAETFDASFQNGGLKAQPFVGPSASRVPADVQAQYMQVVNDLKAGKIQFPQSKAHPCCP